MQQLTVGVIGILLSLAVTVPVWAGFCGLPDDEEVAITVHPSDYGQWRGFGPYRYNQHYQDEELQAYTLAAWPDYWSTQYHYDDLKAGRAKKLPLYCTFTKRYVPPGGGRTVITDFNLYRFEQSVRPGKTTKTQFDVKQIFRLSFDIPYELAVPPTPPLAAPSADPAWPPAAEDEDPAWTQIEEGIEEEFWSFVECDSPLQVQAYLKTYPQGRYVAAARACLAQQQVAQAAPRPPAPPPTAVVTPDRDGCWTPSGQCVTVRAEWTPGRDFLTHFTNECGARIYLRYCHEVGQRPHTPSRHHCETNSLAGDPSEPGVSKELFSTTLRTPNSWLPTGAYWMKFIGSLEGPLKDQTCADKDPAWQEEPVYQARAPHPDTQYEAPAGIVPDDEGCWTPPERCLADRAAWDPLGHFVTHYTNQCEGRLILQYCHELTYEGRQYDPHHCENMVLLPGQSTSWTTHRVTMRKGRPTGRYALQWTGSLRQENDALCRSKVPAWQEEPVY